MNIMTKELFESTEPLGYVPDMAMVQYAGKSWHKQGKYHKYWGSDQKRIWVYDDGSIGRFAYMGHGEAEVEVPHLTGPAPYLWRQ